MSSKFRGEIEVDGAPRGGSVYGDQLSDAMDLLAGKCREYEKAGKNITGVTIWMGDKVITQGPVRHQNIMS